MPIREDDILEDEIEGMGDEPVLDEEFDEELEDVPDEDPDKETIISAVEEALEAAGAGLSLTEKVDLAIAELQGLAVGDTPLEVEEGPLDPLAGEETLPLEDLDETV